jgi:hypothetical protein
MSVSPPSTFFEIDELRRMFVGVDPIPPTFTIVQLTPSQIRELGPLVCKKTISVRAVRQESGWWHSERCREECELRGITPVLMGGNHENWGEGYRNYGIVAFRNQRLEWLKHGGRMCWLDIDGACGRASHGFWCILDDGAG